MVFKNTHASIHKNKTTTTTKKKAAQQQPKVLPREQRRNKMRCSPKMSHPITVKINELNRHVHTHSDETQLIKPRLSDNK